MKFWICLIFDVRRTLKIRTQHVKHKIMYENRLITVL